MRKSCVCLLRCFIVHISTVQKATPPEGYGDVSSSINGGIAGSYAYGHNVQQHF